MLKFRATPILVQLLVPLIASCSTKPDPISNFTPSQPIVQTVITEPTSKADVATRMQSEEKKVLFRLVREIEELEVLIDEANLKANPNSRIKFDYEQLKDDLLLITQGIHAHIRISDFTPRTLKPIVGQYGR